MNTDKKVFYVFLHKKILTNLELNKTHTQCKRGSNWFSNLFKKKYVYYEFLKDDINLG